jgi:hypothetical protein
MMTKKSRPLKNILLRWLNLKPNSWLEAPITLESQNQERLLRRVSLLMKLKLLKAFTISPEAEKTNHRPMFGGTPLTSTDTQVEKL